MSEGNERRVALCTEFKEALAQVDFYVGKNLPENGGGTMSGNIAVGLMICDRLDKLNVNVIDVETAIRELPQVER